MPQAITYLHFLHLICMNSEALQLDPSERGQGGGASCLVRESHLITADPIKKGLTVGTCTLLFWIAVVVFLKSPKRADNPGVPLSESHLLGLSLARRLSVTPVLSV